MIDPAAYRLRVTGKVDRPLEVSLDELRPVAAPAEIVAVTQCSGNSRGHFTPRVNGGAGRRRSPVALERR